MFNNLRAELEQIMRHRVQRREFPKLQAERRREILEYQAHRLVCNNCRLRDGGYPNQRAFKQFRTLVLIHLELAEGVF